MAKAEKGNKAAPAKQQTAPKSPAPTAGVPAKTQSSTAVTVGGKVDTSGMILSGDKADLSHLPQSQRGSENVGMEDVAIPRLEVVQGLSEALKTGQPGYIEGAKQGDLINSVTNQNYGREVFVVPVVYVKQFLVWKDYSEGGGFFGAFATKAEADARFKEVVAEGEKPEHLEVLDTPTHLCIIIDHKNSTIGEIMLPMPKTKAKVSRAWNTMVRMSGVDRFARIYRITTAMEKNKKNQEYWNFVVSQAGAPNKTLFDVAERLFKSVNTGERNVTMDVKGMQAGPDADGGDHSDSEM